MNMTLVFSMGCLVFVPLPDYTESCQKAAVFIWSLFFLRWRIVTCPYLGVRRCKILSVYPALPSAVSTLEPLDGFRLNWM